MSVTLSSSELQELAKYVPRFRNSSGTERNSSGFQNDKYCVVLFFLNILQPGDFNKNNLKDYQAQTDRLQICFEKAHNSIFYDKFNKFISLKPLIYFVRNSKKEKIGTY